jgi:predicted amidophosphoribosyltransferase
VLLVDDVLTTGATLSAAAQALRSAGAADVRFVTAAVAVSPRDLAPDPARTGDF